MIIVNPEYDHLRTYLQRISSVFVSEGRLLYDGRNQIRAFELQGQRLAVKRYKKHNWLKRIVYTFFRKNKALRSYEHAQLLRQRDFVTPREVAYIEERRWGTIIQVYYVCEYTDAQPIRPRLIEQNPFDEPLAAAYARYVARLHEAGILHRDLNPTNVLFRTQDDGFSFELIDINRMRFYDGPVPKCECMENLTLFWWLTDVYRFVLREYATVRGWTEADVLQAISVKQQHDRAWVRRKRITHPFRKQT